MLQKAFFKVDVVDRIYDTLVFEKNTPGAYEFTVPEEYNYVVIEYAGGAGGDALGGELELVHVGGKGSIKKILKISCSIVTGIVAGQGSEGKYDRIPASGGFGYQNGDDGIVAHTGVGPLSYTGAGGGGSTSVVIDGLVYEASGGSGASIGLGANGGKGGGQYGGASQTSHTDGNDATDPEQIGLNSGNGYVKIWAGYDPYFKG